MLRPSNDVIEDEAERKWAIEKLYDQFGWRSRYEQLRALGKEVDQFPARVPEQINDYNLRSLRMAPYLVLDKTDGEHFGLIAVKRDLRPTAYMINRALRVYRVEIAGPIEFFDGSAFEGELSEMRSVLVSASLD